MDDVKQWRRRKLRRRTPRKIPDNMPRIYFALAFICLVPLVQCISSMTPPPSSSVINRLVHDDDEQASASELALSNENNTNKTKATAANVKRRRRKKRPTNKNIEDANNVEEKKDKSPTSPLSTQRQSPLLSPIQRILLNSPLQQIQECIDMDNSGIAEKEGGLGRPSILFSSSSTIMKFTRTENLDESAEQPESSSVTMTVKEQRHHESIACTVKRKHDINDNNNNNNSNIRSTTVKAVRKTTTKRTTQSSNSRSRRKTTTTTSSSSISMSKQSPSSVLPGSRESASLRRIKREWQDAVKLGIAYDWINMKEVGSKKLKKKKQQQQQQQQEVSTSFDNDDSCSNNNAKEDDKYNYVRIGPYGRNLLHWHFSVQGPPNSVYEHGIYHGRVILPKDYPGSPPRVQVITPSGRFQPGVDICLSASSYHPESWTPRWTVLSLVDALRLHMLTTANEIGGLEASAEKRRKAALLSRIWSMPGSYGPGGGLDHRYMVNQGLFRMPSAGLPSSSSSNSSNSKQKITEGPITSDNLSDGSSNCKSIATDNDNIEILSEEADEKDKQILQEQQQPNDNMVRRVSSLNVVDDDNFVASERTTISKTSEPIGVEEEAGDLKDSHNDHSTNVNVIRRSSSKTVVVIKKRRKRATTNSNKEGNQKKKQKKKKKKKASNTNLSSLSSPKNNNNELLLILYHIQQTIQLIFKAMIQVLKSPIRRFIIIFAIIFTIVNNSKK